MFSANYFHDQQDQIVLHCRTAGLENSATGDVEADSRAITCTPFVLRPRTVAAVARMGVAAAAGGGF
jgi:hypothetical protein